MIDPDAIQARFDALEPFLNERDRRLFAASEARAAGRGGIAAVSRTTGMARSTIGRGLADLRSGAVRCSDRVRRMGGGQKPATETQPGILEALNDLVEPSIRGDPEAPFGGSARASVIFPRHWPSGASLPVRSWSAAC